MKKILSLVCLSALTSVGLFAQQWDGAATSAGVIYRSGLVGIGTSSPVATASLTLGNGTVNKVQIMTADGDIVMLDAAGSLTFPAISANSTAGMINMFASGTTNKKRMVLQHSPAYTNWGLQYEDSLDRFHYLANGASAMSIDLTNKRMGLGGVMSPTSALSIGTSDATIKLNISSTDGDLNFTDENASLNFPLTTTANKPVVNLFPAIVPAGTTYPDRMLFAFSSALSTTGLQFQGDARKFNFLNGNVTTMSVDMLNKRVGLGLSAPTATLSVGSMSGAVSNVKFTVAGADGDATFLDPLGSITFPAISANSTTPMINMFASGTMNKKRMILQHSPSFGTWGLQYEDSLDQFNFIGSGTSAMSVNISSKRVGIGTAAPEAPLHVASGKVVIGVAGTNQPAGYRLYVQDGILTEKVKVAVRNGANWADYVFDENYKMKDLAEVEAFVKTNKHLPNFPSAQEMVDNGLDVATMDAKLLEKIEELTLYLIEMKKENEALKCRLDNLEKK